MYDPNTSAIAFHGHTLIAKGRLADVARAVKEFEDADPGSMALTFDGVTSRPIELDLRGEIDDVVGRIEAASACCTAGPCDESAAVAASPAAPQSEKRGPGRPKLGVVPREVTLLPRHWEWLAQQPGGASVTLRKLVEQARKSTAYETRIREARDATYRFMFAVGGDLPEFEEVSRALYAGDAAGFKRLIAPWPMDVRAHTLELAQRSFEATTDE